MVSVCLPSDALLQHLPSYLGFSYLGRGVSLHSFSSKVQPLLLALDEGYLLTAAPPDLERGVAPLGPPVPTLPPLLGGEVVLLGFYPWLRAWGSSSRLPLRPRMLGSSSLLPPLRNGALVIANILFQQHKRRRYTWTSPDGQHRNHIDYIFCSQRRRSSIQLIKTRLVADCGSDHELLPNSVLN